MTLCVGQDDPATSQIGGKAMRTSVLDPRFHRDLRAKVTRALRQSFIPVRTLPGACARGSQSEGISLVRVWEKWKRFYEPLRARELLVLGFLSCLWVPFSNIFNSKCLTVGYYPGTTQVLLLVRYKSPLRKSNLLKNIKSFQQWLPFREDLEVLK